LVFYDQWLWLVIVVIGLLLAMTELLIGVDMGLDLVFIGSGFVVGGLVTWPFHSWPATLIASGVVCAGYIAIGRRYVHRWSAARSERTNVDAIIGKHGIVLKGMARNIIGSVKVGNENWRAVANEELRQGDEIEVVEIKGVTLTVKKAIGGS